MKRSRVAATRRQPLPSSSQQNISHVLRALADAEAAIPTLQGGGGAPDGGAGAAPPRDAPSGSRSPQGALIRACAGATLFPWALAPTLTLLSLSLSLSLSLACSARAQPGRGQVCLPRGRAPAQRAAH